MVTEWDEAWVEEAVARYRGIEQLRDRVEGWVAGAEVTVRSPDELVEVRVCPDGSIRRVALRGSVADRTSEELARSIEAAAGAATAAADWARRTLYAEAVRGWAAPPGCPGPPQPGRPERARLREPEPGGPEREPGGQERARERVRRS